MTIEGSLDLWYVHNHCEHIPNAETRKAIEDAEKGIGLSRTFDNVEDMFKE